MSTGYIKSLAYTEVSGLDENGSVLAVMPTRVQDENGEWITNKKVIKELKTIYGAVKFKRRNVWNFEAIAA